MPNTNNVVDNENTTTNNTSTKKSFIKIRRNHYGILKAWLIIGLIMMLLQNTIWPEISTQLKGLYNVATLWIVVVSEICNFFFPYLQNVGNWITEFISRAIRFFEEYWPIIIEFSNDACKWFINSFISLFTFLMIMLTLFTIGVIIFIFVDKDKSHKILFNIKNRISKWWSIIWKNETETTNDAMDAEYECLDNTN